MASRFRSLSKPTFSILKSTLNKPSLKPRPASSLLPARLFLNWVVFNLCCLSTQRCLRLGSRRVWESIQGARGRCLRILYDLALNLHAKCPISYGIWNKILILGFKLKANIQVLLPVN
ncbi:hypothetical protein QQP08_027678 [Theobroma cacao]|nr:hypothetical protein QQP08_027678 [Theobroma cacao]